VTKLRHQADDRTNRQSFLNFCKIPWNSTDTSKFCGKGQIPQLGSKFHGLRKTVSPTNHMINHNPVIQALSVERKMKLHAKLNYVQQYLIHSMLKHNYQAAWITD